MLLQRCELVVRSNRIVERILAAAIPGIDDEISPSTSVSLSVETSRATAFSFLIAFAFAGPICYLQI